MVAELRAAIRALRGAPMVSWLAILTLAVGVGAATAVFTVLRTVLLAPLPYRAPSELVVLRQLNPDLGSGQSPFAPANYLNLRDSSRSFRVLAAFQTHDVTLAGSREPVRLRAAAVTSSFFETLATPPALGRVFTEEDALAANPRGLIVGWNPVAILSHGAWKARFGGSPDVLGRTIVLDGRAHTVVGVMPPDFQYPPGVDLWLPLVFGDVAARDRGGFALGVLGRLAPGVTVPAAQREANSIAARLQNAAPFNKRMSFPLQPLHESLVRDYKAALWFLFGISALLLLVVCGNTAHLLLVRSVYRQRERAIRIALGATGRHTVVQVITEAVLLAWCGGLLGLLLAAWTFNTLLVLAPPGLAEVRAITIDAWSFGSALVLATVAGAVAAAAPALHELRADVQRLLSESGPGRTASRGQRRLQHYVVATQIAVATVLLGSTSVLVRNYLNLRGTELGFSPEGVATLEVALPAERYRDEQAIAEFARRAVEELRTTPGVRAAAATLRLPVIDPGGGIWFRLAAPGANGSLPHGAQSPEVTLHSVTPDYFAALRIPIRRGRSFAETDRHGAPPVVLVNEELAWRFFPGQDPVGKRLVLTPWPNTPREIVGVVGDTRQGGLRAPPDPALFVPMAQLPLPRLHLVARVDGDPASFTAAARARVARIDPQLGLGDVATMEQRLLRLLRPERFSMWLVGMLGAIGLVLTASGVFGVTSFSMSQRRPEIGIRLALGAPPQRLAMAHLWQGGGLCALGIACGLATLLLVSQAARAILPMPSLADPGALAAAALAVALVALAALILAARRVSEVNPAEALR